MDTACNHTHAGADTSQTGADMSQIESATSQRLYAEVIIPLSLNGNYTYAVPAAMAGRLRVGCRVVVQFGAKRYYTAIVESITPVRPALPEIKEISMMPDDEPIVVSPQIKFWHWIASYYMCTTGEVYKAAVPTGLKPESETIVEINRNCDEAAFAAVDNRDMAVMALLRERGKMPVKDIAKILKTDSADTSVLRLVGNGLVVVSEKIVERYSAVRRRFAVPAIARHDSEAMTAAFARLKRSAAQQEAFMALLEMSGFMRPAPAEVTEVALNDLAERSGATTVVVKQLASKGLVRIIERKVSRFTYTGRGGGPLPALSDAQRTALDEVHRSFIDHDVTLLHGVTSSGKTEIYIHLIDYTLRLGRQVLMLVPEIALTTQLTQRLQRVFGDKVIIYHSKFSDNERVDIWRRLLDERDGCVVVGARSALMLPLRRPGLIIVDEEHESSYKQYDPAPRYNARDAATVLARMHGAKTLLGSATPAIETYHKAVTGKYGLVRLGERWAGAPLPSIEIVDMARERSRKAVAGALSLDTIKKARAMLAEGRQVIFFHNRRGYAPMARCRMCQFTPKCDRCDVSLTYHRGAGVLVCHYCGAQYPVPATCPNCRQPAMEIVGYGTERVEDEIAGTFAEVAPSRILRMDLDTTRARDGYDAIIDKFSEGKADILVGTQMVTKGLDFGGVGLVSVINADQIINYPDYRSAERAFCMLEQVSGRAGRRAGAAGEVIVQTSQPAHPVLQYMQRHDYEGFYAHELEERRRYGYPPFARIIYIYVKHRDALAAADFAQKLASGLQALLGSRVSQPVEPPVRRVQSMYIRRIMVKIEPEASPAKVKEILLSETARLLSGLGTARCTVYFDVDPA